MERKKIAVYIDYAIRVPNFIETYNKFKESLFVVDVDHETEDIKDTEETEETIGLDLSRFFWKAELEKPEVERFYLHSVIKETNNYNLKNWEPYFFNKEHYNKFLEEYSFNLFVDCEVACKRDIDFLNIAQSHLFDVVLIDEYIVSKKKLNTFFFLSKSRVLPLMVVFLGPGKKIAEENYFGVWNPKVNSEQINEEGEGGFEMWLKELEDKQRENG